MAFEILNKTRGEVRIHSSHDELRSDLADYIAKLSEDSVDTFAIAISGGSLIDLMSKLLEHSYMSTIDWSKWHIYWADERVVPKDHAYSNYKHACDRLLYQLPFSLNRLHSIDDTLKRKQAAKKYGSVIRELVRTRVIKACTINDCPKFDLILLGMGQDGHVASLFPNHSVLKKKDTWVTSFKNSPEPPRKRITFTLPVINSAANVVVVATGEDMADAASRAIDDVGRSVPARKVQPIEGRLVWFLDMQAASRLERD